MIGTQNNPLLIFIVYVLMAALFLNRMKVEEEMMLKSELGKQYGEYMKRTNKLIPFLF